MAKRVFSNDMVAHVWAQQSQPDGRSANGQFYFRDSVIYSYGGHFPIARSMVAGDVLMTTKRCSVTTAKHISRASRAVHGRTVFYVPDVLADCPSDHGVNYDAYITAAKRAIDGAKRARSRASRLLANAHSAINEANEYNERFALGRKLLTLEGLDASAAELIERVRVQDEAEGARRRAADRKAALASRERLREWLSGADVRPPHTLRPMVRVRGDHVETTWGAVVPLAAALHVWEQFQACRASRLTIANVNQRIGDFTLECISPNAIRVGCHVIPYRFALCAAKAAGLA